MTEISAELDIDTRIRETILTAVVDGGCGTIDEVMSYLRHRGWVRAQIDEVGAILRGLAAEGELKHRRRQITYSWYEKP